MSRFRDTTWRTMPLRAVVSVETKPDRPGWRYETLDCGHVSPEYVELSGKYPKRRRCAECPKRGD